MEYIFKIKKDIYSMSYIKELFLNHSLLDMNDEQTREILANDQELRLKIADEIIEHIKYLESHSDKYLWSDFETFRGTPALNELIIKNAKGSFCDRNSYDWFELENPYYSLLNFSMDYFMPYESIKDGIFPKPSEVASFIKREVVITNEDNEMTGLELFVEENIEPKTTVYHLYELYLGKFYKKNGVKNRVLFAISCLIMLSNSQEMLMLALENEKKELKKENVKLKVSYSKPSQIDHRFYERAIVVHFKDKEDFLNNGQFLYEIGREIIKENEPMNVAEIQIKKDATKLQRLEFLFFKASKTFSKKSSFTCYINKQEFFAQLEEHLFHHFRYYGRTDIEGKEKLKVFLNLLFSADIECIEIIQKKLW